MNIKVDIKPDSPVNDFRKAKIYEVVLGLRNASGRNDKIEILKKAIQSTSHFREFLVATYDPMVQYHIRKIPEYREGTDKEYITFSHFLTKILPLFAKRVYTGNKAIKHLELSLDSLDRMNQLAVELLIQRDLKAGVSVSTINKACPGLIFEYPCMLCAKSDEKTLKNIQYPALSQLKMDGLRANLVLSRDDNTVKTFSRNGKDLGLGEVFEPLVPIVKKNHWNCVFDGEIVVRDLNTGEFLPRKKSNGIINSIAQKGMTQDIRDRYRINYVAWDIIPLTVFRGEETSEKNLLTYEKRFKTLKDCIQWLQREPFEGFEISTVETREVLSQQQATEHFMDTISRGEEGTILKNKNSFWKDGRSNDQIKMKMEREADLYIKEVLEGKGRFAGKLGAFLCESADGKILVSVGSGFSEQQREQYFDESLSGKVVSVKYNEIIDCEGRDEKSLFLPIFVEIRDDKNTADSLTDLA